MSGVSLGYYYGLQFVRGDIAQVDHTYTRPFHSLAHHNKSEKEKPRVLLKTVSDTDDDDEIDVCGGTGVLVAPLEQPRNAHLLNETERFLLTHCSSKLSDEQEDWMSRVTWNPEQNALFARVMKIIDTARMARLSSVGHHNESVMRSIYTNHAGRQLRKTFAMIKWDRDLTAWLHNTFFSALSLRLLAIYIDMLQYLDSAVPQLVNQLLETHKINNPARSALASFDTILTFLRRSNSPITHLSTVKPSRVAGNPLMLIIPHYLDSDIAESKLYHRLSGLTSMAKIRALNVVQSTEKIKTASQYTNSLVNCVRSAVTSACSRHDSPNVFAAGWGVAALTLLHVAGVEPLKGAVCLGLPLTKKHRPLRNVIGDIKCPVLIIIGTASRWCSPVDVESLVSNIPGDKRVIFIEDADDNLCIPMCKQVECGLTQSMLDQIIIDEIGNFLISISGYCPPTREELQEFEEQELARNRKRKIDATVRKLYPQVMAEDHAMKRKPSKRGTLEKSKQEPIKKEKRKRKIKVPRKSDSPFDYSVSDSERNDIETLPLGSLIPETRKIVEPPIEDRYKTPETSPSQSPQPGSYDPKPFTTYNKFKSSSTAESYMKTYHLSKLRTPGQDGYMVYQGSRGNSPTYNGGYTPNLAKGTPSIYQSNVGFQRWN